MRRSLNPPLSSINANQSSSNHSGACMQPHVEVSTLLSKDASTAVTEANFRSSLTAACFRSLNHAHIYNCSDQTRIISPQSIRTNVSIHSLCKAGFKSRDDLCEKSPSESHVPSPSFLSPQSAVSYRISEPNQWLQLQHTITEDGRRDHNSAAHRQQGNAGSAANSVI